MFVNARYYDDKWNVCTLALSRNLDFLNFSNNKIANTVVVSNGSDVEILATKLQSLVLDNNVFAVLYSNPAIMQTQTRSHALHQISPFILCAICGPRQAFGSCARCCCSWKILMVFHHQVTIVCSRVPVRAAKSQKRTHRCHATLRITSFWCIRWHRWDLCSQRIGMHVVYLDFIITMPRLRLGVCSVVVVFLFVSGCILIGCLRFSYTVIL